MTDAPPGTAQKESRTTYYMIFIDGLDEILEN